MSELVQTLSTLLPNICHSGHFFATGRVEMFAPAIAVDGVGTIALPLLPEQANRLIAQSEQAPYGRGEETLINTDVRRTWQIDASKIHIGGKHWEKTLSTIVQQAAQGLGVLEPVNAELYKMLVYETGSFFVEHRDTEKAPRMFATLIIVLPCQYEGGALMIRHQGEEVELDLHCDDSAEAVFAAFYADCVHAIRPVTQGHRLTLVYNLMRADTSINHATCPPNYDRELTTVSNLFQRWGNLHPSNHSDTFPIKLVYPLAHAYTPAELSFRALKNSDAAVAKLLLAAAQKTNCDIYLALISIEEHCNVEYSPGGYYDEDELDVGEVIERMETLTDWCRPDGSTPVLSTIPLLETELCPPNALDNIAPDEANFYEATGNAGATVERFYHHAALVLWPQANKFEVFNQAGLSVTQPYLSDLTERWAKDGKNKESTLWQEAHQLTKVMLRNWPKHHFGSQRKMEEEIKMLKCLHQLEDTENIACFINEISAGGAYGGAENTHLLKALCLLPTEEAVKQIKTVIHHNVLQRTSGCANLITLACEAFPEQTQNLLASATLLVETFEQLETLRKEAAISAYHADPVNALLIANMLKALTLLQANALGERVIQHATASKSPLSIDSILLPAMLSLQEDKQVRYFPPIQQLHALCLQHLQTRIAEPLAAPANWARENKIRCKCQACAELGQFLESPDRRVWEYQAAEQSRKHVEYSIQNKPVDVNYTTNKSTRPAHTLVCTKNQASYERLVLQRKLDEKHQKLLLEE